MAIIGFGTAILLVLSILYFSVNLQSIFDFQLDEFAQKNYELLTTRMSDQFSV